MSKIVRQFLRQPEISFRAPTPFWIENMAGAGRRYSPVDTHPLWGAAFLEFGLHPVCVEPNFKNFTGWHYADGAFTHRHKDTAPIGLVHARCNVMLKKPPEGGVPIIDGIPLFVEDGDMWLCLASLYEHESTPIKGGDRLIFSFGGLVPVDQIERLQ